MTLTRQAAVERAATLLDHLERIVDAHVSIDAGGAKIGPIAVLRSLLLQRVANVLQGVEASSSQPLDAKRALFGAKEWAFARVLSARGYGDKLSPCDVLSLPRAGNHLRDMLPVAKLGAQEKNLRFSWVGFRRDHVDQIRREGGTAVLAASYTNSIAPERIALHAKLALALNEARKNKPPGDEDWDAVVRAAGDEAQAQLGAIVEATRAIERAFQETRPKVALIGHACAMEGMIAGQIARQKRILSVTMQHGEIGATQVEWARAPIDLITVWGEGPKDRLGKLGVAPEKIVVTGAPWVDRLATGPRQPATGRRRILIALSGAGHSVGMSEHLTHVRLLMEAAAALPQHEWVFRLHPKDDPAIYQRSIGATGAEVSIIEAGAAPDIHEDLARTDLLATVTSASALDAMLHGVPVLTLGRPVGEARPAFVEAGATVHAPWLESLENYVRRALQDPGAELFARARHCVEIQFGALDGGATGRVVATISDALQKSRRAPDL